MNDKQTIIFDIDGTLADNEHRTHYLKQDPKDWDAFNTRAHLDTLIPQVMVLYKWARETNKRIVLLTGRWERFRGDTSRWLTDNGIRYDELIMRTDGDHTDDHEVKRGVLHKLREEGHDVFFAVEDRKRVCEMWREEGVFCFQVANGDF